MNFKIHRGTNEIGGTCIEIWTESTRVIVDLGMPLVDQSGKAFGFDQYAKLGINELIKNGVLPDVEGLYAKSTKPVDAILISHYHQDHHGFLSYANPDIPVYAGKATIWMINFSNQLFGVGNCKKVFNGYSKDVEFNIGDITFHPYWMDHSAFDAYAFLIRSGEKSIFYSGDFRGHGRKHKVYGRFLHTAPSDIDYLLMEGTAIGRNQFFKSERSLERDFIDVFDSGNNISLVYTSSQNIDRLVTIYKACKKLNKVMVVDIYTASIMNGLRNHATIPYPSRAFPEIRVLYPKSISNLISAKFGKEQLYRFTKYKITKREIDIEASKIVMIVRPSMKKDIESIPDLKDGNFIYSLWNGYLKQEQTKDFVDYLKSLGFNYHYIHTSGHADEIALKAMVNAIKPKHLVPIHTFEGDRYKDIFKGVNVLRLKDGELVTF
jgi:ribonuclease J